MKKKSKAKSARNLKNWTQIDENLYYWKDNDGTIWQLLRTPYKEIPEIRIKK
jgi:hypothetical protein